MCRLQKIKKTHKERKKTCDGNNTNGRKNGIKNEGEKSGITIGLIDIQYWDIVMVHFTILSMAH